MLYKEDSCFSFARLFEWIYSPLLVLINLLFEGRRDPIVFLMNRTGSIFEPEARAKRLLVLGLHVSSEAGEASLVRFASPIGCPGLRKAEKPTGSWGFGLAFAVGQEPLLSSP